MKKLYRMITTLEMDRPIDPNEHYISVGGFEVNNKPFDFFESIGNKESETVITFELFDFDNTLGEKGLVIITPEDIEFGFGEFFVFTGEDNEPEIYVKEVKAVTFEYYDTEKDEIISVNASPKVLSSANRCIKELTKDLKKVREDIDREY